METNKKQTAVDYYVKELIARASDIDGGILTIHTDDVFMIKDDAKQMERETIENAYDQDLYGGLSGHKKFIDGKQYYEQTYGN